MEMTGLIKFLILVDMPYVRKAPDFGRVFGF